MVRRLLLVVVLLALVSPTDALARDVMRVRVYIPTTAAQGETCQIGAGIPPDDGPAVMIVDRDGQENGSLHPMTFIARGSDGNITTAIPLLAGSVGNLGGDNVCVVQFNMSLTGSPVYTFYIDTQAVAVVVAEYAPVAIEIAIDRPGI